jgi:mannose-6-phosphate isomerase-like protein (cupin superfamily)
MSDDQTFLHGRVRKRSLPIIQGRPGADAPLLKRLLLDQGELAQFWDGEEPIHYLAFIELRAGAVRGNHYHNRKRELVYVISGEVLLTVQDPQSGARDSVTLRTGDTGMIETGIAHAYRTIEPGQAVEFSSARFDATDVVPCRVI